MTLSSFAFKDLPIIRQKIEPQPSQWPTVFDDVVFQSPSWKTIESQRSPDVVPERNPGGRVANNLQSASLHADFTGRFVKAATLFRQ